MDENTRQRLIKMIRFLLKYDTRTPQSFAIYKRTVDNFLNQLENELNRLTIK